MGMIRLDAERAWGSKNKQNQQVIYQHVFQNKEQKAYQKRAG